MQKIDSGDYSVKAVKMMEHSWGISLEGNLYYMNRKIGTFEDQGNGGPLNIYIDKSDYDNEDTLRQYVEVEHPEYGEFEPVEAFINDMCAEFEDKKMVRRDRKKRTYYSLISEGDHAAQRYVKNPYNESVVAYLHKTYPGDIEGIANEIFDIYPDGVDKVIKV